MPAPNESPPDQPPLYESFVLRLRWRSTGEQARCGAMLQQVDWDAARYFGSLEELLAFMRMLTPQPSQATDEGDKVTG